MKIYIGNKLRPDVHVAFFCAFCTCTASYNLCTTRVSYPSFQQKPMGLVVLRIALIFNNFFIFWLTSPNWDKGMRRSC